MAGVEGYAQLLPALRAIAEADPDRETCAFVVSDSRGVLALAEGRNVSLEPRERYEMDPTFHLALARRLRGEGGRIVAVFHSHVAGPASFSAEDRRLAAEAGVPVMPGVDQIVAGMRAGKVEEIKVFAWRSGEWSSAP
jgi:proteasome lid subunit RPN8/RPN11